MGAGKTGGGDKRKGQHFFEHMNLTIIG